MKNQLSVNTTRTCVILFLYAWAVPRETARQRFITGPTMTSIALNRRALRLACFCRALAKADLTTCANGPVAALGSWARYTRAASGARFLILLATKSTLRGPILKYFAVA